MQKHKKRKKTKNEHLAYIVIFGYIIFENSSWITYNVKTGKGGN